MNTTGYPRWPWLASLNSRSYLHRRSQQRCLDWMQSEQQELFQAICTLLQRSVGAGSLRDTWGWLCLQSRNVSGRGLGEWKNSSKNSHGRFSLVFLSYSILIQKVCSFMIFRYYFMISKNQAIVRKVFLCCRWHQRTKTSSSFSLFEVMVNVTFYHLTLPARQVSTVWHAAVSVKSAPFFGCSLSLYLIILLGCK